MERSSCTTDRRFWRTAGRAACLTIITLTFSACAHGKPAPQTDSPLFQGCRQMCGMQGKDVGSVLETETEVYCDCLKKPPGPPT